MTAVATQSSSRRRARPAAAPASAPIMPNAPVTDSSAGEDDATKGDWLFKQNDLVLGPVTAIVLVEKIKKAELDGDTPVARDGADFRPMKLVRLFREAWEATVEEARLAAEERAYQSAVARSKVARVFVLFLAFAIPAAAAAAASRQLVIARPWDDTPSWIARVPPLVDLPQRPPEVKKVEPVAVAAASTAADDDDDDDDDGKPRDPSKPRRPRVKKPKDPGSSSASTASDPSPSPPPPASVETLSNAQAVAPLKEIQGSLKSCFKAEMESNPDMPAQVVLSYTVTEEGRAINVELDARELRGRPVVGCVQKAVGTLRWPRFNGERKNVSVPFKLGKPKPPGK